MIPPRNILLFHLGALGDFVLTWPLALALSRVYPQSRIIYVTHGQKGALAERALGVESTDIESGWHHLYADARQLPALSLKLLGGAHGVYSFIAGAEEAWAQNVRRLAPQADVCCIDPRVTDSSSHVTEHLQMQLTGRPAIREGVSQALRHINAAGLKPGRGESRARMGPGSVVAIHPGSGSREKCWPAEGYLELARRFVAAGQRVRILIGDVERERWPGAQIEAFASVGEVCRPQTYLDLLACLSGVSVFVGNDSGPSHLAGILGLPTFVLFGPTNPGVWRPLGPRVKVLQREPLGSLDVDEVYAWIASGVDA